MSGGVKHDEGKARYDLVPRRGIEESAKVFAFGAEKYGERNWELGMDWGRLYAALQRHLTAWWSGEELDPESGLSHLAHAGCCWMMLTELALLGDSDQDSRTKLYQRMSSPDPVVSGHETIPDNHYGLCIHRCIGECEASPCKQQ